MKDVEPAKMPLESGRRIEPTTLASLSVPISDAVADLSAESAELGDSLHPRTAASLAALVRIMNAHYSNLIEGHNTRPPKIEQAPAGDFAQDEVRRNLQIEAAAHVRVQAEVDRLAAAGELPEAASRDFIRRLHREFYFGVPSSMLLVRGRGDGSYAMEPGAWRSTADQDVVVGRRLRDRSREAMTRSRS